MTVSLTRLYEVLAEKIGKPQAESLTTYIEEKIAEEFVNQKAELLTNTKLELELTKLRSDLKADMHQNHRQLFWAIIVLFIPLYLTIIALAITIFNLYRK